MSDREVQIERPRRSKLRIALFCVAVLFVVMAVVAGLGYRALHHVPRFYSAAMEIDPVARQKASDDMLRQTAALSSDVARVGDWKAVFTAEQVNGWLAVDLLKNHAGTLPPGVSDPRVEMTADDATVAFCFAGGGVSTVVSLSLEVYLSEPNVIAIRLHGVRAGSIPLPLEGVLDVVSRAARETDLDLQWQQASGDPVALITIPSPRDNERRAMYLEKLELGDGRIFVGGHTEPADHRATARPVPDVDRK